MDDATLKRFKTARAYAERKLSSMTRRRNGKWIARAEKRLERKLRRLWKVQIAWLVVNIEKLSFFDTDEKYLYLDSKTARDEIDVLMEGFPEEEEIAEAMRASAKTAWEQGGKLAYKDFNMGKYGIDFSLVNDDAVRYLDRLFDLNLSQRKGSIARTTRQRIINLLQEAAEGGQSYQETARKIRNQGKEGVFSQARGELIATRELGQAYGRGNKSKIDEFIKESGVIMQKEWITTEDAQVTPECRENQEMGWIDFDAHFASSDESAPRDDHPRCRCDTGYRTVDTEGNPT